MFFHPEKCEVIRVTNKKKPLNSVYKMSDHVLKLVEDKKYTAKESELEQTGSKCNNKSKQHLKPHT